MTPVGSFSLAAHVVYSPQAPWNYQSDAREKNAGGPDDSSQRVLATATVSGLSLRAPRNSAKRHHDGHASPREDRKQPVLSPKCCSGTPPSNLTTAFGARVRLSLDCPDPTSERISCVRPPKAQLSPLESKKQPHRGQQRISCSHTATTSSWTKGDAHTRVNPQKYFHPSACCFAQGTPQGLEGGDAQVKASEVG